MQTNIKLKNKLLIINVKETVVSKGKQILLVSQLTLPFLPGFKFESQVIVKEFKAITLLVTEYFFLNKITVTVNSRTIQMEFSLKRIKKIFDILNTMSEKIYLIKLNPD